MRKQFNHNGNETKHDNQVEVFNLIHFSSLTNNLIDYNDHHLDLFDLVISS